MKNNRKFYLGIDISKPFFDCALLPVFDHVKQPIVEEHFENTDAGMLAFKAWLQKQKVSFDENTILVIENTGVYQRKLWEYCNKIDLQIHIGNAAHIKLCFGIARGKNDKVDAVRLCKYAFKESDELKMTSALNPTLLQLKDLQSSRGRLLVQLTGNESYLKELKLSNGKATQKALEDVYKSAIEGLKKSIKLIEILIKKLIKEDESIKTNYELIQTIPGIGPITALYLVICTNNFAGKISGKQLASYAGVAPFGHQSGISIKGKDKVHKMANKELKKLLHMCALSAMQNSVEIKQYYERKVSEGKAKMSVINAVKNKLVLRVAAVIRDQKPFVDNHKIPVDKLKTGS